MSKVKDEVGNTYGNITVIKFHDIRNHNARWVCHCACGSELVIIGNSLRTGHTISCGCSRNNNTYVKKDDYVEIYSNNRGAILVDYDDFEDLRRYTWHVNKHGYAHGWDGVRRVTMHRLLMGNPEEQVDHINGVRVDNRRCNLRLATQSQNSINTKLRVDNTSGVKGVYKDRKTGRWYARVYVNRRALDLGYFADKDDAIFARKEAEIKYYGEFMRR